MKTPYWFVKTNTAGNLVDIAQNLGNLNIDFLEMDKTFCSRSRMKMSHWYFDGRVMEINICTLMISLLVLGEARIKEDLHST
jgi:hypothetical protein